MPSLKNAAAVHRGAAAVSRIYRGATELWTPPASGPLVLDTFDRADSATSLGVAGTGQAWEVLAETWGIQTNKAYSYSPNNNLGFAAIEAGVSDMRVQVDVSGLGTLGDAGLLFRVVDANNFLTFFASPSGGKWHLAKRVAGTWSFFAQLAEAPTNGRYEVICSGSAITCKVDGATKITATDSAHSTATRAGMMGVTDDATRARAVRFDNFEIGAAS